MSFAVQIILANGNQFWIKSIEPTILTSFESEAARFPDAANALGNGLGCDFGGAELRYLGVKELV